MFTGLVETKSRVVDLIEQGAARTLRIDGTAIDSDPGGRHTAIGDSVCINGCCLTVVSIDRSASDSVSYDFEAGEETLSRTTLGQLQTGGAVNLERALAVGDRLGGHYVTGHVDAVGRLISRRDDGPWAFLEFSIPQRYGRQVAGKGSIAIDGVSLTVVEAAAELFTVALIPHTLSVTTLGDLTEGSPVNLETDVLAKYVEKSLGGHEQLADSRSTETQS